MTSIDSAQMGIPLAGTDEPPPAGTAAGTVASCGVVTVVGFLAGLFGFEVGTVPGSGVTVSGVTTAGGSTVPGATTTTGSMGVVVVVAGGVSPPVGGGGLVQAA